MDKDRLDEFLRVGEKVLWRGEAAGFKTMNKTYRRVFLKKLLIALGVVILLTLVYILFCRNTGRVPAVRNIVIIAVCGGISLITVPTDAGQIRRFRYAATDQRLIVYESTVRQMDYRRIREARFVTDEDGLTTLLCGSKGVHASPAKWRSQTVYGDVNERNGTDPCKCFIMYAVNDPEGLRAVLREKLLRCDL